MIISPSAAMSETFDQFTGHFLSPYAPWRKLSNEGMWTGNKPVRTPIWRTKKSKVNFGGWSLPTRATLFKNKRIMEKENPSFTFTPRERGSLHSGSSLPIYDIALSWKKRGVNQVRNLTPQSWDEKPCSITVNNRRIPRRGKEGQA